MFLLLGSQRFLRFEICLLFKNNLHVSSFQVNLKGKTTYPINKWKKSSITKSIVFEFTVPGRSLAVHLAPPVLSLAHCSWRKCVKQAAFSLSRANRAPAQPFPMCGEPQQHLSVFYMLINHPLLQKGYLCKTFPFLPRKCCAEHSFHEHWSRCLKHTWDSQKRFEWPKSEFFSCFAFCPWFCILDLSIQCLANALSSWSMEIPDEKVTECCSCGKDKDLGTSAFVSYFLFSTQHHVIFVLITFYKWYKMHFSAFTKEDSSLNFLLEKNLLSPGICRITCETFKILLFVQNQSLFQAFLKHWAGSVKWRGKGYS